MATVKEKQRCGWAGTDPLYNAYHDKEWGVPSHDDQHLFEMLNLEGAQAGLSWYTVLTKRENYRAAFDNWDAEKIVKYSEKKVQSLMQNPGIIRNELKIRATISNAKAFLAVQREFGSFSKYIWQFTGGKTIRNAFQSTKEIPAKTDISDVMSKDLKKRGFKFVGSTICYAYMQACGMVDDHVKGCFKFHP